MLRNRTHVLHGLSLCFMVCSLAWAQEDDVPPTKKPQQPPQSQNQAADPNAITTVTVEKIMDQAVKNIAKRYNLNDEQIKLTDEMMKTRVRKFLKEHEAEVWPLIREMLLTQMGTKPPQDPDEVKRIGRAARPLSDLAMKAILEGNEEWRRYLTPEQQRMHDYDLAEMDKTFKEINRNLEAWAEGKAPRGGIFPPPPAVEKGPSTPPRPARMPDPTTVVAVRPSFFDVFVEQFIKDNELDPGQLTSARSILIETKGKANDFRVSNKDEIAKYTARHTAAAESKDREQIAAADEARRTLMQPVYQLFEELESRLTGLLTSVQLSRYKERSGAANPAERHAALDAEIFPELQAGKRPTTVKASEPGKASQTGNAKPAATPKKDSNETGESKPDNDNG